MLVVADRLSELIMKCAFRFATVVVVCGGVTWFTAFFVLSAFDARATDLAPWISLIVAIPLALMSLRGPYQNDSNQDINPWQNWN